MTKDKYIKTKKGFDFLSPFYDFSVRLFFGNSLDKSQFFFLKELGPCKSILVFGGGTGKILPVLGDCQLPEKVCYVDLSEKMIAKAKKRPRVRSSNGFASVEFVCGSFADIPADSRFDLIITPYVLDCLVEPELFAGMQLLKEKLSTKGKWLFVDFNIPKKGPARYFSWISIRMLYFFFNIVCGLGGRNLPDFSSNFEILRFKLDAEKYFCSGMLTAKVYSPSE